MGMIRKFQPMGRRSRGRENVATTNSRSADDLRQRARSLPFLMAALTSLFGIDVSPARALDVEEVRWGFDEKVVVNTFAPLSVLVSNPTQEAFEGRLRLEWTAGAGSRNGAPLQEVIYLAPYTSRWVQFYPYMMPRYGDDWILSWGRGPNERMELIAPTHGDPAQVLLDDAQGFSNRGGGVKRFPAELFPPMVTATDGLESVILDHVPQWEDARRQAFFDWIARGGVVHLLHGVHGDFPVFSTNLALLNSPLEIQQIGNGWVFRYSWTRSQLDARRVAWLKAHQQSWIANREPLLNLSGRPPDGPIPMPDAEMGSAAMPNNTFVTTYQYGEVDGVIHNQLKELTQPQHNWWLIHTLSWLYFVLLFPGCYVLATRRIDYRMILLAFTLLVAGFSAVFATVGKRGYGESTAVHSVAIARPLPDGFYDVTQWSNAFVTDGDFYTIRHRGAGQLYSTAQVFEAVNGVIDNGLRGAFRVDIPPFSSRTFLHRAKIPGKPLKLTVEQWDFDAPQPQLALAAGGELPADFRQMCAIYGNQVYQLHQRAGGFTLGRRIAETGQYLQIDPSQMFWMGQRPDAVHDDVTVHRRFDNLFKYVLSLSFGVHRRQAPDAFRLPPDRVRIALYGPMSDEFFIQNEQFGKQFGYVLYLIDVFAPENP